MGNALPEASIEPVHRAIEWLLDLPPD